MMKKNKSKGISYEETKKNKKLEEFEEKKEEKKEFKLEKIYNIMIEKGCNI